jgi:hypothetical protein
MGGKCVFASFLVRINVAARPVRRGRQLVAISSQIYSVHTLNLVNDIGICTAKASNTRLPKLAGKIP